MLCGAETGNVVAYGNLYIGYSSSALQLKRFCLINNIPLLTMHSGRRGGATVAMDMEAMAVHMAMDMADNIHEKILFDENRTQPVPSRSAQRILRILNNT